MAETVRLLDSADFKSVRSLCRNRRINAWSDAGLRSITLRCCRTYPRSNCVGVVGPTRAKKCRLPVLWFGEDEKRVADFLATTVTGQGIYLIQQTMR